MSYQFYFWDNLHLKTKASKVTLFNQNLKDISDLAIQAMIDLEGVGVAANQIGFDEALFVYRDPETEAIETVINPTIVDFSLPKQKMYEGCLSIPEYTFIIPRYENITVNANNLSGEIVTIKAEGFKAQILQHEIDHLNGVRILDRLSQADKKRAIKQIKKL